MTALVQLLLLCGAISTLAIEKRDVSWVAAEPRVALSGVEKLYQPSYADGTVDFITHDELEHHCPDIGVMNVYTRTGPLKATDPEGQWATMYAYLFAHDRPDQKVQAGNKPAPTDFTPMVWHYVVAWYVKDPSDVPYAYAAPGAMDTVVPVYTDATFWQNNNKVTFQKDYMGFKVAGPDAPDSYQPAIVDWNMMSDSMRAGFTKADTGTAKAQRVPFTDKNYETILSEMWLELPK